MSAAGLVFSERRGGCCQAGLCVLLISSGSHPASTALPLRVLRKAGKGFAFSWGLHS